MVHGEVVCRADPPIFNIVEDLQNVQIKIGLYPGQPHKEVPGAQLEARSSIDSCSSSPRVR